MDGPVPELTEQAERCAERLSDADRVLAVSHIDADGLTSAGIASAALSRAGLAHEVRFEKQLDEEAIARIAGTDYETVLFTDFGSGQLETIAEHAATGAFTPIVADHHQPADADVEYHLNPLRYGIDGSSELSGAGTTYVLARALGGEDNLDLAALAVVGAVGDMQGSDGGLVGANEAIVEEGVRAGVLDASTDLALYGTQTRPLPKLLEYASELAIPGLSDQGGVLRFLDGLDLSLKSDGEWRCWVELSVEERRTVVSALVRRAVERGVPADRIEDIVGTTYTLLEEEEGTELRDASEFSTVLNATARYERADVGLAVCLGDRDGALDAARRLLSNHRRNLSAGVRLVQKEGVRKETHVQWFHARDRIPDTIVGIVAGMAFGSDDVDAEKVIVAFANADEGEIKVSARGTSRLVRRGLDLSAAMGAAATAVDGEGGGHTVAAGATIPAGRERAFIERVDALVGEQIA